jgi:hypothetical protein
MAPRLKQVKKSTCLDARMHMAGRIGLPLFSSSMSRYLSGAPGGAAAVFQRES